MIINELYFSKEVYYILYNCYIKFKMVKICYEQFGQRMLLLVKTYTINLLIKKYMRTVQLGNIVASKNFNN
jgi:hypothetical protein